MPQLDRSPWFAILLLSWLIFLVVIPAKVTSHFFPNSPTVKDTKTRKNLPWTWLWH
uniref:ATP synthase F0 subunit 8 n=1 Tax=Lepidopus altifrons TaxID=499860 RepID=UPI0028FC934C|nr:ATP synthase F0 subunit 8 [Lepidopus altifrons]WNH37851.1 ATP synthase F0 subunit 8 [Lepidopus altifrons]